MNVANALKFLDQVRVLYKTELKSLHRRAAIKESKRSVESDKVEKNTQKIRSSILERKASKSDQSFPLKDPLRGSLRDNKNNKAVLRDLQDPLRGPSAPTLSEQRGLRDNNFQSTRECIFVSRSSIITPNMVGLHVFIHDGKE